MASRVAKKYVQVRKRVEVSCAKCGIRWMKRADSMAIWRGYCRKCHVEAVDPESYRNRAERGEGKPQQQYRRFKSVTCPDCGESRTVRDDAKISGKCKSCVSREIATRPGIKEIMRETGRKVMARVGKLPHYPDRNYRRGPANNKWRGGITSENQRIRHSPEMKAWRMAVFARDGYRCVICDAHGDIEADHIEPFSVRPDLRFDVENGRTLCVPCHRKHGAKASHGKLTRAATGPIRRELRN